MEKEERKLFTTQGYVELVAAATPDLCVNPSSFALRRCLARILAALTGARAMRYAFEKPLSANDVEISLEKNVPLQAPLYGVLLCLRPPQEPLSPLFPHTQGNALFFTPDTLIPLASLYTAEEACYLLLVFTTERAVVVAKENPLYSFLDQGFDFGDRLEGISFNNLL